MPYAIAANTFIAPRGFRFLHRIVNGAKKECRPFPHLFLSGPPGVGKTTIAHQLAKLYSPDIKLHLVEADWPVDKVAADLRKVEPFDFLLLDEAHFLKRNQPLLKLCLKVAEEGVVQQGKQRVELPPYTLVVATDQKLQVAKAFRSRARHHFHVDPYEPNRMRNIILSLAAGIGVPMRPYGAAILERSCFGIPRNARNRLEVLRHYMSDRDAREANVHVVRAFLREQGIDPKTGLGAGHRRYLYCLRRLGQASLARLAALLRSDKGSVFELELPLVERFFVVTDSNRGRRLTHEGETYIAQYLEVFPREFERFQSHLPGQPTTKVDQP